MSDTAVTQEQPAPPEPRRPPPVPTGIRALAGADLLVSIVGLGLIAGLGQVRGSWPAQAAEFVLLLTIPGFLLLRALCVPPEAVRSFPLYIVGGSLVVIMICGLVVDLIGPPIGVSKPLHTLPLTVALASGGAVLILIATIRAAPSLMRGIGAALPPAYACWTLLLPVAAWIGATRLNNGHGPAVAIATVVVTGVVLLLTSLLAPRMSGAALATTVFATGLALMWGFSLRGQFVYGFDIAGEYQTFAQVLHAGKWTTVHHNDAYGAMLSLTVLPSTFSAMTGAGSLLVLKAIFPLLFALFPVGLLRVAMRVLKPRWAFLAVLFVLVQTYLFQQLPAIARQEIALLLFICMFSAVVDDRMTRSVRLPLIAIFTWALVVSHYGTTYLTIVLFGSAIVLELLHRRFRGADGRVRLIGMTTALTTAAVAAAIWYVPVTDSAQNLRDFFGDISSRGLVLLPNSGGHGIVQSYISGNVATSVSGAKFQQLARDDYKKNRKYVIPLPQAFNPQWTLQTAQTPGQRTKSHLAVSALDGFNAVLSQLLNLTAAIGALLLWLRRREDGRRRTIAALGVSTLAVLVVIRISGTAASDYNQERAFLQAMVPLSICMAWLLDQATSWVASKHRRLLPGGLVALGFTAALALFFFTTSGLRGPIVGGGTPTNLADKGEDYERFYVTQNDLAAARWLNRVAPPGDIVSTDRYGALRVLGATGRQQAVLPVLTPETIDRYSWVYADTANFAGGRARGEEGNSVAVYHWPPFIARYWNLVYTNGRAAVYVRSH